MNAEQSSNRNRAIPTATLWILGLVVIFILWIGTYYYLSVCRTDLSWNEKGSIGDSFGAVSALFSGLAFLAVIITIYLQSRSLRESKANTDLQNFENKFFQLVRVHQDILDGIEAHQTAGTNQIIVRGRQRIYQIYGEFVQDLAAEIHKTPNVDSSELINRTYAALFGRYEHEIGHYFRHLYNIVAFIDRSSLSLGVKKSYTKLLRAQLSSHELLLLFFNCLWDKGRRKFKPLVEKYALLEHMPKLKHEEYKSLYNPGAFAETDE